ncbi:MAG TPA: hypothetical protein VMW41_02720 [Candidatus Bathyarchaeia archaeon]|nr:hypothetical protein [Candidatus Bathyarchaeia archaeon]
MSTEETPVTNNRQALRRMYQETLGDLDASIYNCLHYPPDPSRIGSSLRLTARKKVDCLYQLEQLDQQAMVEAGGYQYWQPGKTLVVPKSESAAEKFSTGPCLDDLVIGTYHHEVGFVGVRAETHFTSDTNPLAEQLARKLQNGSLTADEATSWTGLLQSLKSPLHQTDLMLITSGLKAGIEEAITRFNQLLPKLVKTNNPLYFIIIGLGFLGGQDSEIMAKFAGITFVKNADEPLWLKHGLRLLGTQIRFSSQTGLCLTDGNLNLEDWNQNIRIISPVKPNMLPLAA